VYGLTTIAGFVLEDEYGFLMVVVLGDIEIVEGVLHVDNDG
jgi:hypothetical protein